MRIGLCFNWKNSDAIKTSAQAGIDYIEAGFGSFVDCTDDEFKGFNKTLKDLGIPCLAYNCMLPGDKLRVVGNGVDFNELSNYFNALTDKLSVLDGRRVVFGAGSARAPRGEVSGREALRQIGLYLKEVVAPIFINKGWECVIEPLCECEVIKTINDGSALVDAVDSPVIKLLIDFYHALSNGEDVTNLLRYKDKLRHVHVAALNGRYYPKRGDGTNYVAIFEALKEIDYDGDISIEAKLKEGEDFSQAIKEAVICLKEARKQVYGY
ncbi:MAG: sugar phosphate isomerase/epimerase [Clostridia bacterium]|nr:sugar phosphate isomerase/epimerase [Clostridia bacterium]